MASAASSQRTLSPMATADPTSGVVVRIRLPAALARLRARDDRMASVGVPPHITLLFPFVPVDQLGPAVRRELAAIAATVEPFEVRFARVDRFPGAVYLVPEPSAPFVALTTAIVERFPDHPPYDGAFAEIVPHLTLVESTTLDLDPIAAEAGRGLPFARRVSSMELLVEDGTGRWHGRWRIPLGVRR
jgi:2'-5' RNA ligase